jgi:hypothetical protein
LQFLIKKIEIKFPAINFLSILGHQTLDPDPGSGSAVNQCGSKTLPGSDFFPSRIRIFPIPDLDP